MSNRMQADQVADCAGAIKEWFEARTTPWIDASAVRRQHNAAISVVVYHLYPEDVHGDQWGPCGKSVSTWVLSRTGKCSVL